MERLALFLDLQGMRVLLLGGGAVALRRARSLLAAGATVEVWAAALEPELQDLAESDPRLRLHQCRIQAETAAELLTERPFMVVLASSDQNLNDHVAELCRERQILCNHAADPASQAHFAACLQRPELSLAAYCYGAPSLAQALRDRWALEDFPPERSAALASNIRQYRELRRCWSREIKSVSERRTRLQALARTFWQTDASLEKALQKLPCTDGIKE